MGKSVSWFAVGLKPAARVLQTLFLRDTGNPVRQGACKIAGAVLPNGWLVVVMDEFWHPLVQPQRMLPLSDECVVVGCSENESVNTSLAFCYSEGRQQWQVSHILDEGFDHLAIEGKPPQSTPSLLAHARKQGLQKSYDAVFDVPASLAHQISGFRYLERSDLHFTEFVPVELVSIRQVADAFRSHMAPMMAARGFVQEYSADDGLTFVAQTDQDEVRVYATHGQYPNGGCWATIRFAVRNHLVQALSTGVPGYGHSLSYKRQFGDIAPLPDALNTAEDLAKWMVTIDAKLPAVLDGMRSIRGLEALANDGSPRRGFDGGPTLSHYDTDTGLSRLVLAYLVGNPNFERMVAETDAATYGGASPSNGVHQVVAYLKANAKPVP